jgi:hypothetical protein
MYDFKNYVWKKYELWIPFTLKIGFVDSLYPKLVKYGERETWS